MKFLYSDTQDYVDPEYDFISDLNKPGRRRYWDDKYAHELMAETPYDGLLVSMSAIRAAKGVSASKCRYSTAEEQRFLRVGAREFLRFNGKHQHKMLMGDCGAFAYADHEKPAYEPLEVVEFYTSAQFTHGCHPDHIIFDFLPDNPTRAEVGEAIGRRYDITFENAREFLRLTLAEGKPFEPIGVVQGWSPQSMTEAAIELEKMGYGYLAIGGMVPLGTPEIHLVMQELRKVLRPETKIHLLGFAKADQIGEFTNYGITSFDSTSPLIRAFKDAKRNFYLPGNNGKLEYYSAIRIPQAIENPRLLQAIKRGTLDPTTLQRKEQQALCALRGFDKGQVALDDAVEQIVDYQRCLVVASLEDRSKHEKEIEKNRRVVLETLRASPWKRCSCSICRDIGVEVIIFRSANRNRRRGFHNLGVYHSHVQNKLSTQ